MVEPHPKFVEATRQAELLTDHALRSMSMFRAIDGYGVYHNPIDRRAALISAKAKIESAIKLLEVWLR